ncbi:MAG: hypothetical protein JWQ16_2475 [Novosphingobium sp.]|nr:hypothetical protein [Novosphingobium sp.]
MTPLQFSVAIIPRGKGRPRATVRGSHASVYTDSATRKYEAALKVRAQKVMAGAPPLQGPLAVSLRFRIPVPVSYSKKRRAAILAGVEHYAGSGDIDNHAKAALDAFNGVVFVDDKQISQLLLLRRPSEKPGIDVRVEPFPILEAA